ncbi:unnamed protein product [Parnassius apollo]|uniref:(apollo) hypothetical protein n=1 Tax=Parnassius apollo TaxID=110799 RepID=A0A8S3W2W4_PARAO|nr:unnamed protein product [Parnassius apollo]
MANFSSRASAIWFGHVCVRAGSERPHATNRQQRRILSWLEEDVDDILGGDDEENETEMFPDKMSEHDTDSEQECNDDLL